MAHYLEKMAEEAEKLIKQIKLKYKDNKQLGRQIVIGARETADYSCSDARWSTNWYLTYIKELKSRA